MITSQYILSRINEIFQIVEKNKESLSTGTFKLAGEFFNWKTIDELEPPHTPRHADKFEMEHFNVSPFEWSVAREAALRALKSGQEPEDILTEWEPALIHLGRKGLLKKLGLTQG
jgi:hypothetical protein